ncbi:MAG: dihydrodipicolinate synthase family protein [Proteobacteria bacterium]|nr:dihydrodipicolinate synthase family protein [Pseudomonadota bacterium]
MLITPFDSEGRIAWDDLHAIADRQIEAGVSGLSILGLAAESSALDQDERIAICRHVLARAGKIPVIAGCTGINTSQTVSLATAAAEAGVVAVMVAPPARVDWSREQLKEHYCAVARAIQPTPLMVQDAPAFIGTALDTAFVTELAQEHSNVEYAKPESIPASDAIGALAPLANMGVFGGHGGLYFLEALEAGADGLIPGCEQPHHFQQIYTSWLEGHRDAARRDFARILPLLVWQFQSLDLYIACVKSLLHAQGLLKQTSLRGKPWPLSGAAQRILLRHARRVGLI